MIAVTAAALVPTAPGALADPPKPADTEVWTFENDAVGAVSSGCATLVRNAPAVVSDQNGYHSGRSLLVSDMTAAASAGMQCTGTTRHGATLSFETLPAELPNGFTVDFYGELRDISGTQSAFHLLIDRNGQIRWYDGSAWIVLAPSGTVMPQRWNHYEMATPRTTAWSTSG